MTPGSTPEYANAIAQGAQIGPNNGGRGHYCSRCQQQGTNGNPQQGNLPVIVINNTDSSIPGLALGNVFVPAIDQGNVGDTVTFNDGNQYVILEMCGCCNIPQGCTDPDALNYDQSAHIDDGSCEYPEGGDINTYPGCIPTFCPECQAFEAALEVNPDAVPPFNPETIANTCLSGCCEDPGIVNQYLNGISYSGPYPNIESYVSGALKGVSAPSKGGPVPKKEPQRPRRPRRERPRRERPRRRLEEQFIERMQKLANIKRKK